MAKIYHKGSEYASGNGKMNHHRRVNSEEDKDIFPVDNKFDEEGNVIREGLRSISDRILRYEISFKNSYFSHLHKRKFFAKECPVFEDMKEQHVKVKTVYDKCNRKAKKELDIKYRDPLEEKKIIKKYMEPFRKLPKEQRRKCKHYEF